MYRIIVIIMMIMMIVITILHMVLGPTSAGLGRPIRCKLYYDIVWCMFSMLYLVFDYSMFMLIYIYKV